jgi:hypothetical protein
VPPGVAAVPVVVALGEGAIAVCERVADGSGMIVGLFVGVLAGAVAAIVGVAVVEGVVGRGLPVALGEGGGDSVRVSVAKGVDVGVASDPTPVQKPPRRP